MNKSFFLYILVMFGVTYLIRVLPLLLIRKKIENKFIRSFLAYIPYTVLGAMTFPAIFHAVGNPIAGIGAAVCGIALAFCNRGLIVVAAGSSIAAYVLMRVFGM